jgi:cytochrome P450
MLDLAACRDLPNYISHLRSEILTELEPTGGRWTKEALARMISLDSVLRESMRMWGFVSRGVMKEVVAKDGVTLPSGQHLPCGAKVGIHASPVHRDEDIYPDALEFKPFRFRNMGSPSESHLPTDDSLEKVAGKGIPLVTTSSNFMAFSHGKHAWCVPFLLLTSQSLSPLLPGRGGK